MEFSIKGPDPPSQHLMEFDTEDQVLLCFISWGGGKVEGDKILHIPFFVTM